MKDRVILHCDCNGFYASVEQLSHPEWRQVPMAVCGDPAARHGIILAKNEAAKAFGVQTAETIGSALRKCPQLVLAPPHHDQYAHWSRVVNAIYARYTEQVEPFGIDESWLDVTGSQTLFGDGPVIAERLRREVRQETGLTISVGVSFNKVFAKLGSDHKKPDATTVIRREDVPGLVWPKPAGALLYVGHSCQLILETMGIRTIGQIAQAAPEALERRLGKLGRQLWDYANGRDLSPVASIYDEKPVKSVGSGLTFPRDLEGEREVAAGLLGLCDDVAVRLRRSGLRCRTVQLTIKDPALRVITRQRRLEQSTDLASVLRQTALDLWREHWDADKPIRMLTVTAQNLVTPEEDPWQLMLFEEAARQRRAKQARLERTMDAIREKYGKGAIVPAELVGEAGAQAEIVEESKDGPVIP